MPHQRVMFNLEIELRPPDPDADILKHAYGQFDSVIPHAFSQKAVNIIVLVMVASFTALLAYN